MKVDTHARLDPDLLSEVKSEIASRSMTLTDVIEDGLRRWLKAVRKAPQNGD